MATSPASEKMLDVLIRAGMITVLVIFAYRVFYPFLNLLLWSMILAVTMYPLHLKLKSMLGGKDGRAATVIVLVFIALLLVPIYLLGSSIAGSVQQAVGAIRGGGLHVPPPDAAVAGWPVIGDSVYALWQRASTDLAGVTEQYQPNSRRSRSACSASSPASRPACCCSSSPSSWPASSWPGARAAIAARCTPQPAFPARSKGPQMAALCTATIRAVAQGVIGHRLHPDVPGRHRLHSPARAGRGIPVHCGAVSRHHPGAGHDRHHPGDRLCHLDPGRHDRDHHLLLSTCSSRASPTTS
jgi:hypothetical protein